MIALVLLALASPALRGTERGPLPVAVLMPAGAAAKISREELVEAIAAETRAHTPYVSSLLGEQESVGCKGALGCLVHLAGDEAHYLLVVSVIAVAGKPDRIVASFVDAAAALAEYRDLERNHPGWEDEWEVRIAERAVIARFRGREVDSADGHRQAIQELFAVEARPALEEKGRWDPFGTIALRCAGPSRVAIFLDGAPLGEVDAAGVAISDVRHGERVLRFEAKSYLPLEKSVGVEGGRASELEVTLERDDYVRVMKRGLFWGGLGSAAAGIGAGTWAIARGAGGARMSCFSSTPGCVESSQFEEEGGVMLAPLGYSLILAGGVWVIAGLAGGDGDVEVWLELALGLAAGALSYGLSAAAN